jgi:putative hemolysin
MGMIHTKDLIAYLHEPDNFNWHHLMRQPYFVHEQKFIEDLLKRISIKADPFCYGGG